MNFLFGLQYIKNVFEESRKHYWLAAGTLLGKLIFLKTKLCQIDKFGQNFYLTGWYRECGIIEVSIRESNLFFLYINCYVAHIAYN